MLVGNLKNLWLYCPIFDSLSAPIPRLHVKWMHIKMMHDVQFNLTDKVHVICVASLGIKTINFVISHNLPISKAQVIKIFVLGVNICISPADGLNTVWTVVILHHRFWLSDRCCLSFTLLICFCQLSNSRPSMSSPLPFSLISIPSAHSMRLQRVKARTETASAWGVTSLIHIHPHLAGADGAAHGF